MKCMQGRQSVQLSVCCLALRTSCWMLAAAAAAGSGEVAAELTAPPLPRPAAQRVDVSALVPDSSRLSRGTPGEGTAGAAARGSMAPKDKDVPAGDDTCQHGTDNHDHASAGMRHHCNMVCESRDITHLLLVFQLCLLSSHCTSAMQCVHAMLMSGNTDLRAIRQAAASCRRTSATRREVRWRLWGVRRECGLNTINTRPREVSRCSHCMSSRWVAVGILQLLPELDESALFESMVMVSDLQESSKPRHAVADHPAQQTRPCSHPSRCRRCRRLQDCCSQAAAGAPASMGRSEWPGCQPCRQAAAGRTGPPACTPSADPAVPPRRNLRRKQASSASQEHGLINAHHS